MKPPLAACWKGAPALSMSESLYEKREAMFSSLRLRYTEPLELLQLLRGVLAEALAILDIAMRGDQK